MMTKLEALEKCRDHWRYMAETGSDSKEYYFRSKGIKVEDFPISSCYCCEYDDQFEDVECNNCPLVGYGWDVDCLQDNSLYFSWEEESREHLPNKEKLKIYASDMV